MRIVAVCQQWNSCTAANSVLFEQLVGAGKQRQGKPEAERFRRLEVDYQLQFGRLLDWQWSAPLEPDRIMQRF